MCVSFAMAFAFNLYLADVIIRLRQDVQIIRKRLGVASITFPSIPSKTSFVKRDTEADNQQDQDVEPTEETDDTGDLQKG